MLFEHLFQDSARLKSVQFPPRYAAPHCHAKKHRVTGWTTEFTDVSTQSTESEESIDEDSFIYSDDGSGATADESQAMGEEKLYQETHRGKERPKSSKYRIRLAVLCSVVAVKQKRNNFSDLS